MLARAIARKVSFVKFEYDAFDTHFHKHFQPKHLISNQANAWLSRFAMILSSILNSKSSTNVTRCWSVRIGCAALHCIALCCAVRSLCAHTIININNILHTKFYSRISPIVCFCLLSTANNNKTKQNESHAIFIGKYFLRPFVVIRNKVQWFDSICFGCFCCGNNMTSKRKKHTHTHTTDTERTAWNRL